MAALSVVFDSLALHTEPSGPYLVAGADSGIDIGANAIADALLGGDIRPEEVDQVAAELRLTRIVVINLRIRSTTADLARTNEQALISKLVDATRFAPKTLTITPNASTHVSTLKVFGGTWQSTYTQFQATTNIIEGTLTLSCDWPVYGAAQNLGSSGSPLSGGSNAPSPASVTLTPSPAGDLPMDVTLFVKNRSASSIRSLLVSAISGNTTWTMLSASTGWTPDTNGTQGGAQMTVATSDTSTIRLAAHFNTPALPTDRRFRVYLRFNTVLTGSAPSSFRVRLVTGQAEVIGPWRTPPYVGGDNALEAADMGAYNVPVSAPGSGAATTTTVYIEARGNETATNITRFNDALFVPDDSTIVFETSDTSKVLAAASATVQVETDHVFDASGNAVAGAVSGSHIRAKGTSRFTIYTSQQYMANLVSGGAGGYAPENIDAWAIVTPRYVGLA